MRQSSGLAWASSALPLARVIFGTSTVMGTATRVFSQRSARLAEVPVTSSKDHDSHSWDSPAVGLTDTRAASCFSS